MADLELIKKHFNTCDRFALLCGIEITEVLPGYGRTEMMIKDKHLNGMDVVQGGVIFTMCDLAFAAASNSHGISAVGMHTNISYYKPGTGTKLIAEAREITRTNKLGHYTVQVHDDKNELVAEFHGIAYFLHIPFPPPVKRK